VHARLERAVQRGAARGGAGLFERVDLRVRLTRALVRALPDHHALVGDDARADDRIRRRPAEAAARVLDCPPHPSLVVYHLL
jgi:hypothetical protein